MKTPEQIFDKAIQAKGLDVVSVKDADLYEAGLDAIRQNQKRNRSTMREILFRAKRVYNNKWFYGYLSADNVITHHCEKTKKQKVIPSPLRHSKPIHWTKRQERN